jgi:hypothetical protein
MRASGFVRSLLLVLVTPAISSATWQPNGNIITPHTFTETNPALASDGHRGAFAALDCFFAGPFVQRFQANGEPAGGWDVVAKLSTPGVTLHGVSRQTRAIPDGAGGCFLVWIQSGEFCPHGCSYNEPGRLRMQRLTARGTPAPGWPAEGFVVSEKLAYPASGFMASDDGRKGVWIAWQGDGLFARHFGPSGTRTADSELTVTTGTGWQSLPQIVGDHFGGAYVFWSEGPAGGFPRGRIRGQHYDAGTHADWGADGRFVSTGTYDLRRGSPSAISTRSGDAVIAWSGVSGATEDIFAARVNRSGSSPWQRDHVVCGAEATQADVHIVAEPEDEVLISWRDARPAAGVFAQRFDRRGRALWAADGVPISPGAGDRTSLVMCEDGAGGAFLAWTDRVLEWSVLATRIDRRGQPADGWSAQATPVCHRNDSPYDAQATSLGLEPTGPQAAMLCWQDFRIPPTVPQVGFDEASFVMRLGRSGPGAPAAEFPSAPLIVHLAPRPIAAPPPSFAIHSVFPNPSNGAATVRLSLGDESPASLEVFDLAGRRVSRREVGGAPGEQVVPLSPDRHLSPGLYLVRLAQRQHSATARLIVTR